MKINISWLQEKNTCQEGVKWFLEKYPKQSSQGKEYQSVLDDLAKENKYEWAEWLMAKAGSTNTELVIEGDLILEHNLFFSGSLKVTGKISTIGSIEAGLGIKAGGGIEAGEGIKAGWDYGIYVGISIKLSLKSKYAIIKSKTKPKNLILGEWQKGA